MSQHQPNQRNFGGGNALNTAHLQMMNVISEERTPQTPSINNLQQQMQGDDERYRDSILLNQPQPVVDRRAAFMGCSQVSYTQHQAAIFSQVPLSQHFESQEQLDHCTQKSAVDNLMMIPSSQRMPLEAISLNNPRINNNVSLIMGNLEFNKLFR